MDDQRLGPATCEALAPMSEPEVGETATTVAEMCVFVAGSGSVAGASAPVSSSERRSPSADVPFPASAEAAAAPGFAWRLTCPAAAGIFGPPWRSLSSRVRGEQSPEGPWDGLRRGARLPRHRLRS